MTEGQQKTVLVKYAILIMLHVSESTVYEHRTQGLFYAWPHTLSSHNIKDRSISRQVDQQMFARVTFYLTVAWVQSMKVGGGDISEMMKNCTIKKITFTAILSALPLSWWWHHGHGFLWLLLTRSFDFAV